MQKCSLSMTVWNEPDGFRSARASSPYRAASVSKSALYLSSTENTPDGRDLLLLEFTLHEVKALDVGGCDQRDERSLEGAGEFVIERLDRVKPLHRLLLM